MKDILNPVDALGQQLVIGNRYGYSSSAGSRITVVIGTLAKINEKKVTILVESRKYFLYGQPSECSWKGDAEKVFIHPCHLFPLPSL